MEPVLAVVKYLANSTNILLFFDQEVGHPTANHEDMIAEFTQDIHDFQHH